MNRARGFIVETGPEGRVEYETFTCGHCSQVVRVPHRAKAEDVGGFCRQCFRCVCPGCHADGSCKPFEKKLEEQERRGALLRSVDAARR